MSLQPYLQYFSQFENLPRELKSEEDLSDGVVMQELLSRISGFPVVEVNPRPQTFSQKFSNLKAIQKGIEAYWGEQIGQVLESEEIDLVEVAKSGKGEEIVKMGELFIRTAVQSHNKAYFIEKILSTSGETQQLFMSIIELTIGASHSHSPRKEKERRLYDKIVQLDHENDKLRQVIHQICEENHELQKKCTDIHHKLQLKEDEVHRLNKNIGEMLTTPLKKNPQVADDTAEKDHQLLQKIKAKMVHITKDHQNEIQKYKEQLQFFSNKLQRLNELEQTIQAYQERIADANTILNRITQLQTINRDHLVTNQNQSQQIQNLTAKLHKLKEKTIALQQTEIEYRLEIEKKNIQIEELLKANITNKKQQNYIVNSISLHKTLSQQCPEIMHSQTQALNDANKILRQELQRTIKIIRLNQIQLAKYKNQSEKFKAIEDQNKKLTKILKEQANDRGQENQILMGCLYEMKKMVKGQKFKNRQFANNLTLNRTLI